MKGERRRMGVGGRRGEVGRRRGEVGEQWRVDSWVRVGEINGEIVPSFPGFTAEVPHLQGTLSAVSCGTDQLCQVGMTNSMPLVFPAVHTVSDCRHATTAGVEVTLFILHVHGLQGCVCWNDVHQS